MTDKNVETIEGLVSRTSPGGRRTYSLDAKRTLVRLCLQPGVSVAALALAHGINANLLRRWIEQFGPQFGAKSASTPALLPISTAASLPNSVGELDGAASFIEISFMDMTVRVHGIVDGQALRVVLDCVARRT